MSLKDLTWDHHKDAERQEFVKVLMSGKINPELYATYLWNQHKKYDLLEALAGANGLLHDLPGISRKQRIEKDYLELWKHVNPPVLTQSTRDYIMHMKYIMHDSNALMAHVYVLHMGDLSGGQMIAKKVPGSGLMYQFDENVNILKEKIRARLDDSMADEAKLTFDFAAGSLSIIDCKKSFIFICKLDLKN